ncbi:MAG: sulfatase-like hydrolase/transferase, partial [Armatimonadetes bacterium]|nr:sulfatase-like hydrolase/transferase [Armatimonadota bacterium]NIM24918.1 sulfatase-like hydrolase/transferase [Armatimonadota bacterium]NIM68811.1 sulfatase-like hydrolase/transferase [Armatimonadota bacterium]NIN07001.1 sulfatase-like hydrolase/transferase [Armatimonadota bacterium]NIO98912.1 sulfatase-like hydrolase/transferase [Armatimonadota bacterium]
VGWKNETPRTAHPGSIGCLAFVAPGESEHPFVYSEEGSLWHVFRVPEKAALHISFKPVLPGDVKGDPQPFVPSIRAGWALSDKSATRNSARPPDVFIYLIDALRADHLGCYGYSRDTSPNIDAFADEAVLYEQAHAASTSTRPSVSTLQTGLYPASHGVIRLHKDVLAKWPVLQAEVLQESGYATCFVTCSGMLRQRFGFEQGIESFSLKGLATSDWACAQAARFLTSRKPEQPVWVYVHTIEPHSPYAPKPASLRRFDRGFDGACDGSRDALHKAGNFDPNLSADDLEHLIDLYDGEVFDSDTGFGEFLELLKRSGRFENALIILVADHGEAFAEHDTLQHGNNLNQEQLQVPLIIKFPASQNAGLRIKERVSLADIFPTVMARARPGLWLKYQLTGVDLAAVAQSGLNPPRRIYAQLSPFEENNLDLLAIIDEDGFKRVLNMSVGTDVKPTERSVGLWDLNSDPDE